MIHVFIVDDHKMVIEGLELMLAPLTDIRVIGTAESGDCLLYTSPSPRD